MMTFAALQTGVPTITAPQIMMATGIVGLFIVLFKIGSVWGRLNESVDKMQTQNKQDAEALRAEVRSGFGRVDTALMRLGDTLQGVATLVTGLSATVEQHDRMLHRTAQE